MDSTEAVWTKHEILRGQPFLLDADDVISVGSCNKACYMAMGWLLNKAASKSSVDCVVLKQTMPDGLTKTRAVRPTAEGSLLLPWEMTRIPNEEDAE